MKEDNDLVVIATRQANTTILAHPSTNNDSNNNIQGHQRYQKRKIKEDKLNPLEL
jgi:hypothetical protein